MEQIRGVMRCVVAFDMNWSASNRVGRCAQSEHDPGTFGFPAHPAGAQALLDQALAGGLDQHRADWPILGEQARIVHLTAMVVEQAAREDAFTATVTSFPGRPITFAISSSF